MNEEEKLKMREKMALFKHGMISPVLYEHEESQNKYFKRFADRDISVPGIGIKRFSVSTFKSWLSAYRKKGYEGIKPGVRKDRGKSRKISPKFKELVIHTLKEMPMIKTYSQLYRYLMEEGFISSGEFTLQTFIKYLKDNDIKINNKEIIPRKKFETEHINQLWMCDFMHSIYIRDGKKKRQTFLCAIIDDHSRVIVGHFWSFDSAMPSLEETLKGAIMTYGLPSKFYSDNAKVFTSQSIHLPCAKLGIAVIHSRPFDASSRGKIERFFRTVQQIFIPEIHNDTITLDELKTSFKNWLHNEYHKKLHTGINEPPMERYLKDLELITPRRIDRDVLDLIFYRTIKRVVKLDSTVSIDNKLYEVPSKYIGLNLELRYAPSSPQEIFIFENDMPSVKLRPLDLHLNANSPHISLSYSNLFQHREV